jgi:hypothetical protein
LRLLSEFTSNPLIKQLCQRNNYIKLSLLPSSDDIIKAINRIVEIFSNPTEIEVVKTRWEEIEKLESVSTSIVAIAP